MNDTLQELWPGWKTVRMIGRGGFGAVYEVQRELFGDIEKAAVKCICIPQNESDIEELVSEGYDHDSISNTFRSYLKGIVSEYSMMRKLSDCPNIVSCDDVRYIPHEDGIGWDVYIKMELLEPVLKNLPQQIHQDTVVKLGRDMCAALTACGQYNIIHRDIKPQNIFLSGRGSFKLGDFGIAKAVERTMGGTRIGTYKYMAPEVYNNQPYGVHADIYSLGLVLYWMLNERRMPFLPLPPEKITVGMDESARVRRLSGEPLPPPANGSDELKRIVLRACAYAPEQRYATAEEMLRELERLGRTENSVQEEVKIPAMMEDEGTVLLSDLDTSVRYGEETVLLSEQAEPFRHWEETVVLSRDLLMEDFEQTVCLSENGELSESEINAIFACEDTDAASKKKANTNMPGKKARAKLICVGNEHAVALLEDGTVKTAGDPFESKCQTKAWRDIIWVCCGDTYTLGLCADGTLRIAGYFGVEEDMYAIKNWKRLISISAGPLIVAGLTADARVHSCGLSFTEEWMVSRWKNVAALDVGDTHIVALRTDGTVMAAGGNGHNQCGVRAWCGMIAVAAGGYHTLALKDSGKVRAVGDNSNGQCNTDDWRDVVSVKAGVNYSAGLRKDGTVLVAGADDKFRSEVASWRNIRTIYSGGRYLVGYRNDGKVRVAALDEAYRRNFNALLD